MGWNLARVQHFWSKRKNMAKSHHHHHQHHGSPHHHPLTPLLLASFSNYPLTPPQKKKKKPHKSIPQNLHRRFTSFLLGSAWYLPPPSGIWGPGPNHTFQADLYAPLTLPCILVGDSKLGGISTTVCAYEALKAWDGHSWDGGISWFECGKTMEIPTACPPKKHKRSYKNLFTTQKKRVYHMYL